MSTLQRIIARIRGWLPWFKPPVIEALIDLSPPAEAPKRRRRKKVATTGGEHLHITDVLDLLPRCRKLLVPMRQIDLAAYQFWRVFGAKLVNGTLKADPIFPPPAEMPAQGMSFWHFTNAEEEDIFPGHFGYFSKLERNPYDAVVPTDALAVFNVSVAYTDHDGKGFAYEYFVAVNAASEVSTIPHRQTMPQHLPRGGTVYHMSWGIPKGLEWHFKQVQKHHRNSLGKTVHEFGATMFRQVMGECISPDDDFQVRAERDGVSVAFNVGLGRTPQFFRDRETGLAADGKRKRIFHAVEEHERTYPNGKVAIVPAHYRGERSFLWKGEAITITPVRKSFQRTFKFSGVLVREGQKTPKGLVDLAEHAEGFRKVAEADWRKSHPHGITELPWRAIRGAGALEKSP